MQPPWSGGWRIDRSPRPARHGCGCTACTPRRRAAGRFIGIHALTCTVLLTGCHASLTAQRDRALHELQALTQPVRITECRRYWDGGSIGLALSDGRGSPCTICFAFPLFEEERHGVYLGTSVPDPRTGVRLAPGSVQERQAMAFLLQVMDSQFGLPRLQSLAEASHSALPATALRWENPDSRLEHMVALEVLPFVQSRLRGQTAR